MRIPTRFAGAIDDLVELPFRRYPASLLLRRAYELRATVTVCDAVCVAFAEALDCDLVTADSPPGPSGGARGTIRVLRQD